MIRKSDKTRFSNLLDLVEDWLNKGYRTPFSEDDGTEELQTPAMPPQVKQAVSLKRGSPQKEEPAMPPPAPPSVYESRKEDWPEGETIEEIGAEILQCQRCSLYLTRNSLIVPGVGTSKVKLMVITPPPVDGASKEAGPLGKKETDYLKKWLEALELDPSRDAFITPVVKCRTPAGRPPRPVEASSCLGYLHRQFHSLTPKAVLILGSSAASILLGSEVSFSSMLGKLSSWNGVPAMALWEPKEVLFHPSQLRKPVWEALKKLKASWNALP